MKHGIEINGVANLLILVDELAHSSRDFNKEVIVDIKNQLDLLERYMLAYNHAVNSETKTPYWHEVRQNPILYPTNRERR